MSDSSRISGSHCRWRARVVALKACLCFVAAGSLQASEAAETQSPVGNAQNITCPALLDQLDTLSLASAVDLALCNNAQVRGAWANVRVQAAALGEARASYWPTVSVVVSELNDHTAYPGSPAPATTRTEEAVYGSFTWHLFDFGGRAANLSAARSLLAAAAASRDALIERVLSAAVQTYFDVLTTKALLDSKVEDRRLARSTLDSAQRRLLEGQGANSDVLQAASAEARATLDENHAQSAYQKALSELTYTLGLPAGSRVSLPADVDARTGSEQEDLSFWLKDAEQRHPAVIAARAGLEASRSQINVARSGARPTIDLTGNYYQNGFPQQGLTGTATRVTTIGLSISVPLFDGFSTHYKVRSAEATADAKQAELDDTLQSILKGVVEAYSDAEISLENVSASRALLTAAEAAFDSATRRYEGGAASIIEVLTTESALADARAERVQCLAQWRSARLQLLASAGILERSTL